MRTAMALRVQRWQLSDGVDPTLKRRAEKDAATNTLKAVADAYDRAQLRRSAV
jgi:hypothetical protein